MAIIVTALVLIAVALLQVTILPALLPTTFRPDAVLAASITWGALASYRSAVPFAVASGFLVDLWSDGPIGLTGLLAGMVAWLTILGETPLIPSNVLFPISLAFGGEILLQFVRILVFQAIGRQVEFVDPAMAILLLTAVSTALLVLPFYLPARWLQRRFGRPRVDW